MKTRIKELREMHGLTQQDLANRVNVTRQTILFMEKGKYNPSLRLAWSISKVFDAPIEEVFSFDDEEKSPSKGGDGLHGGGGGAGPSSFWSSWFMMIGRELTC